jgi:uncharacterized membrane protein YhaH (DUF805 family)
MNAADENVTDMPWYRWYLEPWRKYAIFKGRAGRKEYWVFCLVALFNAALFLLLTQQEDPPGGPGSWVNYLGYLVFWSSFLLVVGGIIPACSVTVRRLHDLGMRGWLLLLALVPFAGWFALWVYALRNSQPGTNKYGPNPTESPSSAPV